MEARIRRRPRSSPGIVVGIEPAPSIEHHRLSKGTPSCPLQSRATPFGEAPPASTCGSNSKTLRSASQFSTSSSGPAICASARPSAAHRSCPRPRRGCRTRSAAYWSAPRRGAAASRLPHNVTCEAAGPRRPEEQNASIEGRGQGWAAPCWPRPAERQVKAQPPTDVVSHAAGHVATHTVVEVARRGPRPHDGPLAAGRVDVKRLSPDRVNTHPNGIVAGRHWPQAHCKACPKSAIAR